jgi:hypothetical protein
MSSEHNLLALTYRAVWQRTLDEHVEKIPASVESMLRTQLMQMISTILTDKQSSHDLKLSRLSSRPSRRPRAR